MAETIASLAASRTARPVTQGIQDYNENGVNFKQVVAFRQKRHEEVICRQQNGRILEEVVIFTLIRCMTSKIAMLQVNQVFSAFANFTILSFYVFFSIWPFTKYN